MKLPRCVYSGNSVKSSFDIHRYRVFVFVSFLFRSSVIKFDKKCANSTQRSQSPNSSGRQSKLYSPRRGYLSPGNSIVLRIAATLLFISVRFFLPILGVILSKLKQASNRPVYFRYTIDRFHCHAIKK